MTTRWKRLFANATDVSKGSSVSDVSLSTVLAKLKVDMCCKIMLKNLSAKEWVGVS